VEHVYGDDGVFTVTVCAADDDTTGNCSSTNVTVTNTNPTATISESGTVVVNGVNVIVTNAGASNAFSASSSDPGSDDLTFTWNWDDGSPNSVKTYFANAPVNTPDPDPSPDVNPRVNVVDSTSHTFGDACLYDVQLTVTDDDAGSAVDSLKVIVTGNAAANRSAGYWFNQYRQGSAQELANATLDCYLDIVELVSTVFSERRAAGTIDQAEEVLKASAKGAADALDRQLLTAWLNFANGATGLADLVDTNGDGTADTAFLTVLVNAEAVRTNPASTRAALLAQYQILERINNTP
jgi:PKD domain-containing protein